MVGVRPGSGLAAGRPARALALLRSVRREHRTPPELHHRTAPLQAAGPAAGGGEVVNLWAGEIHELATDLPAGELTRRLAAAARLGTDGGRG
jgi:hypothetical protein